MSWFKRLFSVGVNSVNDTMTNVTDQLVDIKDLYFDQHRHIGDYLYEDVALLTHKELKKDKSHPDLENVATYASTQ